MSFKKCYFFLTILSFVLSGKIIYICNDIAQKHENVIVKDLCKYEKLKYKQNKLKLDIQLGVYPKFFIFKLLNISNKDALAIRKRLFHSTINKPNKELHYVSRELSQSETFLSKQLSTIDFNIIKQSITSHNKKLLQKLLNTYQKKLSSLMRNCSLPTFTSNETITNLTQYELSQEEVDSLEAVLSFMISFHP